MRGGTAIAGLGAAVAVCLWASAAAAAQTALPLWIDPHLLAAPASTVPAAAKPVPAPRFTVTRIAADGSRTTEAIDAVQLQALSGAAPPPAVAGPPSAAPPASSVAERRVQPSPFDAAVLQAAARRLTLEPTWTALARHPLAAGEAPSALARSADGKAKTDGRAGLGLRDGRRYGETGRFYLYAGMKNRGVGMNVVDRGEAWSGDGLSYDQGGFAGQRSAGLGWRQGEVSTSLGWVHEKNRINGLFGAPAEKDDRVAVTFSWRPAVPAAPSR